MAEIILPDVAPELEYVRDQAIAALAVRKRLTLQGAANELADQMANQGYTPPGPTVAGPGVYPPERVG